MIARNSLVKVIRNILLAGLLLLLLLLLVFIGINAKDKPPSAAVVEFQQAWDNRAPVQDEDNGYLYLLGFDVAQNLDPKEVGIERVTWSNEVIFSADEVLSFPQNSYNIQIELPQNINELLVQCHEPNQECIESIEKHKLQIVEWATTAPWIDNRYQQLIAHQGWLELAKVDIRIPLPNYSAIIRAQRLAYIRAFAATTSEDATAITALLDQDLRFWRTVLRDTDMLIGKMIAVVAIKNNFLWANHILLTMSSEARSSAIPVTLKQPFTDEELSIRRSLIGEWFFSHSAVNPLDGSGIENITGKLLIKLVYKKQDTLNKSADFFKEHIVKLDVPIADFESAVIAYNEQQKVEEPKRPAIIYYFLHPYNPVGKILFEVAKPAYNGYIERTNNLEAYRRGLLASIEQMEPVAANDSRYSSPYPSKPFVINREQRSITVNGLGNDAKSQQVYFY